MTSLKRRVLIPTDFSNNAWSATLYAINLYAQQDCIFYFLNSWSLTHADSRAYITTSFVDGLAENSNRKLEELKARIIKLNINSNHNFEVLSTSEDITPAIQRAVKTYKIDLVVTGTKGATGIDKYFLGSNTVKIIQNLKDCPMLAVPDAFEFKTPKHIAFPTDFNRVHDLKELQPLIELTNLYTAHIYIMHIKSKEGLSDLQKGNMRALQSHMENYEHTFHWMEKTGTKSNEINEFIDHFKIDILVMVHYKHSLVERIIKEPVIKNIGYQPTVPFLVIPK